MDVKTLAISDASAAVHFDVFTLFPAMFTSPLSESILRRAQDNGLISIALHDIRAYTTDKHHVCDDTPYGGGGGMVMKPEPIFRAVETVLTRPTGWVLPDGEKNGQLPDWQPEVAATLPPTVPIVLLSPQGQVFTQDGAAVLREYRRIALICGRYEGVDERVRTELVTHELSIGDFVLSGGELAAMVVIDAITRLLPGALGYAQAAHVDSHSAGLSGLLEGPHYTRPITFRGVSVPDVLLSGHHARVAQWRREQALLRTLARRPELLGHLPLSETDQSFLSQYGWRTDAAGRTSEE